MEDAFHRYERALQKECEPELSIQLPLPEVAESPAALSLRALFPASGLPAETPADGAAGIADGAAGLADRAAAGTPKGDAHAEGIQPQAKGDSHEGAAHSGPSATVHMLLPPPPPPAQQPIVDATGGRRTVLLRIDYQVVRPVSGLRFQGAHAVTDIQVNTTSSR